MRTPITTALALTLGLLALSACSSAPGVSSSTLAASSPSRVSGQVSSSTPAVATSPTPVDTLGATPPTTPSDILAGTYRTRLTAADLAATGIEDSGQAGTWTLIVKKATYLLRCAPVTSSGADCGGDGVPRDVVVEVGSLKGTGSTVWFVHDPVRTLKLTGCVTGCPMGGYRLTWKKATHAGIAFSHYVGLGDEAGGMAALNNWTARPWVRIA